MGSFTQDCAADSGSSASTTPVLWTAVRAWGEDPVIRGHLEGRLWSAALVEDAAGLTGQAGPSAGRSGSGPACGRARRWQRQQLDDVVRVWPVAVARQPGRDLGGDGVHHGLAAAEQQRQCLDDASSAWCRGSAGGLLTERVLLEYSPGYECSADTAWPA